MTYRTRFAHTICRPTMFAALIIVLTLANTTIAQSGQTKTTTQEQDPDLIVLEPSGLPDNASPESILPSGAIGHLRINNFGRLLDDASSMATPFIPEKVLGPSAEAALKQPNPLLALIGMQTMGQPLSIDMLVDMSGIDPARPATLSFYMLPPDKGFAVCIPVLDLNRASALLNNLLPPQSGGQKVDLEGGSALKINLPDLTLYVLTSADTVCICGSTEIAQAILSSPAQNKLSKAEFIADAVQQHKNDNLWLAIDNSPVKSLLPALGPFRSPPQMRIEQFRNQFLQQLDDRTIESFNQQLQTRLGVRDLDEFLDYLECIATGSYEVIFETLVKFAEDLNCLTAAIDMTEEFQSMKISVFADSILRENSTQPIQPKTVRKLLPTVPGNHNHIILEGQAASAKKSVFLGNLISRIGKKMTEKELKMGFHEILQNLYEGHTPAQQLDSKVDWTMHTKMQSLDFEPSEYDDLVTMLTDVWNNSATIGLKAIPPQKQEFMNSHFEQQSQTRNSNNANWRKFWKSIGYLESYLHHESNSHAEELDDGIHKLVSEDSITTATGFFGYNEHSLVSRYFTLFQNRNDYTLIWPGGDEPDLFRKLEAKPLPPAIDRLFANAGIEEGVHRIEIVRVVHLITGLLNLVNSAESILHKELDNYLTEVRETMAELSGEDMHIQIEQLENIEMPAVVKSINLDRNSDEPYLVTIAGLTYPRKKIATEAIKLFKEFDDTADQTGGAIAFEKTSDGRFDLTIVQSTSGISKLTRSVGNNIADQYLSHPDGQKRVQQLFQNEHDHAGDQILLENSMWNFTP